MCGIDGFWGPPDRALLEAMTEAQRHRGPDDEGYLETDVASLGFRRLSIIDIEHGNQPVETADGRLHIVYNGEVYNFRELRAELEPLGHSFHTTCDTEVVLHAYQEWGTDCFARFNGMWGLAILDRRGERPRLVLARDHFGIKPLYYAAWEGRVLFASEIKGILQHPIFPRAVDEQMMYEYLAYGLFDHTSSTFFDGVKQVSAASYVVIDDEGIEEHRYWEPVLSEDAPDDPAAFRAVFERAVERRLVADVPVGICLSGGLDSGSICTVMAQLLAAGVPDSVSLGDRLKTFSATFPGDPIDESDYIDSILEVTGADTRRVQPTAKDFVDEMEAWVWHVEEPMISSAPFAMWMVMRLAREQVKVVLDGQAGDELLAGYDHYPYVYLRQLLKERRFGKLLREAWDTRDVVVPLVRRRLRQRRIRVDVRSLLDPEFRDRRPPHDDRSKDDLKLRLVQDFVTYSLPPLLRYEDRNSMAISLEARLPFLDQELVDYVLALPADAIIRHGWNRWVLRQALRDALPRKVYRRRKKIGFTTPEFRWYRRERAALQSLMRSPSFTRRTYWNGPAVAEAFRLACIGEREESPFFWRCINAEVWMRIFVDDEARALDEDSYTAGFARRGDAAFAARNAGAEALFETARPHTGTHLFLERGDDVFARVPLRSKVIGPGDNIVHELAEAIDRSGAEVEDGDLLLVSEKTLGIAQGRAYPIDQIHPTRAAAFLSRFVVKSPIGVGLGHPTTMQLAIDEVGLPRILAAAAAAAVTRPFGARGTFYKVAGGRVNAIDGPSSANLPPYDKWAMKAPADPEGEALRIAAGIRERTGCRVEVAVIDANDINSDVFATTPGADPETVLAVVVDNPLGQADEQTPFGLVRRFPAAPQSARELAAAHAG
jgi:asparagine synthase (glutamine-hydrolysing)